MTLGHGLSEGAAQAFSNPFHVEDFTAGNQFTEVFGQATEHAAGVLVGPDTKHVGALKFQQHRHLMEHVCHLVA